MFRFFLKIFRKLQNEFIDTTKFVSKVSPDAPWVYISYIPEALYFAFDKVYMSGHQSRQEMKVIVDVFNKKGYNVFCSNYQASNFPELDVKFIFGVEPAFISASLRYQYAKKIYYATGAYSHHQNTMIKKRTDEFNKAHKSSYPYQRLVENKDFLSRVDSILQIGSTFTIDTYPENLRSKITTIHQSSTISSFIDKTMKNYGNRTDILWVGGSGEVLKGLDLVIDALKDKSYKIHVVGDVSDDFKSIYEGCNAIKYYGFMNVNSSNFIHLCEKCNFLLYPSCTEGGCPGAVINSMRLGVIPIVSKWAAFDEIRDYGYMLRSLDIASINDALEWMQDLPLAKIESLSNSCIEFSKKYYNLERFQQEFSAYIDNLLSNA